MSSHGVAAADVDIIRRLAERKVAMAHDPVNLERKRLWYAMDAGESDARPMVLAEFESVQDETSPLPDSVLECVDPWARSVERGLRVEQYRFDVLQDDHVVEPWIQTNWQLVVSDYGVRRVEHVGDNNGRLGSKRWDPPITDLARDFHLLHQRTTSVDREATLAAAARLESLFGGILPVRIRGMFWWTMGMTWTAIDLIGLENLMLFMFDDPEGLHRLMTFIRDDLVVHIRWLEREGLLSLDNENDYIGSGSMGYTHALPQPGHGSDAPVGLKDMWILLESQETVGVGPDQFEEFIFPYQLSLAREFGRCYYGCCEPVHTRWHVLKRIPHMARVSISPWADEPFMAEALGRDYVYSRKPNPTLISTPRFDEDAIRADIRHTLDVARGCRIELIMKDVHTLSNEPARIARWVAIAREEAARLL